MLYIYIETHRLKILALKKILLGQQEVGYFEKRHEVELLPDGKVSSVDILASALKEGITNLNAQQEKEIYLVLPQSSFAFTKMEIPADITPSAAASFIQDKARSALSVDIDACYTNYFLKDNEKQKQVSFYAIEMQAVEKLNEVLKLLGLKLVSILPDTLAIFKLFEKTLRKDKKEHIFYVSYNENVVEGYHFDSGGLYDPAPWKVELQEGQKLEDVLKSKTDEFAKNGMKLNRIILSGTSSENIRQDTFTKAVGAWTNPLKRIIPNFYDEYLKTLVIPTGSPFPLLLMDVCFGAYVFSFENKDFQLLKKSGKIRQVNVKSATSSGGFSLFRREVFIFLAAFILSFAAFFGLSKLNLNGFKIPSIKNPISFAKPTPTPLPTATPTPTPAYKKADLKVKILNGSGTRGKASEVKDLLSKAGYENILTANADNFDYTTTVFQIKNAYKGVADQLTNDLDGGTSNPKVETLDDKNISDIIIIIGSDFK